MTKKVYYDDFFECCPLSGTSCRGHTIAALVLPSQHAS